MQKKSLKSKAISASCAVATVATLLAGVVYAASAKDMRFFLQANDGGCTSQLGYSQHTDFVNKTTGLGFARWVTDANGYDPDCYRVNLEVATPAPAADLNKDFRACLQFADYVTLDAKGQITSLDGAGTQRCTPWASEGGGVSVWATDSNKYDPDGAALEIETKALPAGTTLNDIRLGIQMSDSACTKQVGTVQYTPWASQGGGWSSFATDSNAYDPDCGRIYLDAKVTNGTDTCSEASACPDQKVLSLANNAGSPGEGKQYATGARVGASFGGPVPSIFTLGKNLTYEAWIFERGHNRYGGIISMGDGNNWQMDKNGWPSLMGSPDGYSLIFRVGKSDDVKFCTPDCREYALGQDIPLGVWTHVAVTVADGKTLSWYINGKLVQENDIVNWNVSDSPVLNDVTLGVDFPGLDEYFNGSLDEVRIWNIARTAAEIKSTMNTKVSGNTAGLVDYWNFDNGTGEDITGHTEKFKLKAGASIAKDPAISPLKLCTIDTCGVQPPPPQNGDLRIERVTGTALNPMSSGTAAYLVSGNADGMGVTANPAIFTQIATGNHTIKVTNLSGDEEFAMCQFARGGTLCTPTGFVTIPAANCDTQKCSNAAPVADGKVTRVVIRYAIPTTIIPPPPPLPASCADGIDNDQDGLIDGSDIADCNPSIPGGPRGEIGDTATCTFTANPATIVVNVGSSKLTWNCTTGPVTITDNNTQFTDIGVKTTNTGFVTVSPDKTTTFTVTAGGATASATVTVGGSVIDETGGL